MDLAALAIVDRLLHAEGLRAVARQTGRPVSSISLSLRRVEEALAVSLIDRRGARLIPSLEGERLRPRFRALAAEAERFCRDGHPCPAVSLEALARITLVARTGSVRAAARLLGLGQPQLSRQIAHVEAQTGVTILERSRKGAEPTAEGLALIEAARRIGDLWAEMTGASAQRFRRSERAVRIGALVPLGPDSQVAGLVARIAAGWRIRHPRQPLFISATLAEDLLNGVRRGLFDAILLDVAELPEDLEGKLLSQSPLALVSAEKEAHAGALPGQLLARPLVLPSARTGLRQAIDLWLDRLLPAAARQGLDVLEVDSIPVILRMVRDHGFLTILPESSIGSTETGLACRTAPDAPSVPLSMAWLRARRDKASAHRLLALAETPGL